MSFKKVRYKLTTPHKTPGRREFFGILLYVLRKSIWKYDLKYILLQKGDAFMKNKKQKNFFVKMVEDKKAIIRGIREGVPTKIIEEERDVKFATPV